MNDEQTVADEGAQDDLDSLLEEFDQQTTETVPVTDVKDETIAKLQDQVSYLMNQTTGNAVSDAVKQVQKNLDIELPDRAVRGLLNDMAIEDPRLQKAFQNRDSNPAAWNKLLQEVAKTIRSDFSGFNIDKTITEDRAALEATVRGASKATEDDVDFSKMSDVEFEQWKRTGKR